MSSNADAAQSWRRRLWWQLPLLGLTGLIACNVFASFKEEVQRFIPEAVVNCSTHNVQGSGYKAFFEVARRSGLDCEQFERSYREMPDTKAVLVVIAPNMPMKAHEIDRVLNWVYEGQNLVYLDYFMYGSGEHLLSKTGLSVKTGTPIENMEMRDLPDTAVMRHVKKLVLTSETRLVGAEPVLSDSRGALLVKVRHGKGFCLVGTLPSLCANNRIADTKDWGNFQFLINWLKSTGGKVLFDERVHGYSRSDNFFVHVMRGPCRPLILQLLIIFTIICASLNQRFGSAKSLKTPGRVAEAEFINGMALTYEKARAYDAAWSILYGSFHTRLCKSLSVSSDESIERLAAAWSRAVPLDIETTTTFLREAESARNSHLSEEEQLKRLLLECDRLYEFSKPYLSVQSAMRESG